MERYGILGIAWLLLGYFGIFDLGLSRAAAHKIAQLGDEDPAGQARALWTCLAVVGCVTLLGDVLLYVAARAYFSSALNADAGLRGEILASLPLIMLALPMALFANVMMGALNGREQFGVTSFVNAGANIATQVLPLLAAVVWGPTLPVVIGASLAVRAGTFIVLGLRCKAIILRGHRVEMRRDEALELLRFGGWVSLAGLVAPLLQVSDRLLLGWLIDAKAVAVYAIPSQIAQRANILALSVGSAVFPRLASLGRDERSLLLVENVTRVSASIMTPAVAIGIVIMEPFLKVWLGGALGYDAVLVGQLTLVGQWFASLSTGSVAFLQASGRPKTTALVTVLEVPPYMALLVALTLKFGLTGAAAAYAIRWGLEYLIFSRLAMGKWSSTLPYILPGAGLVIITFCAAWTSISAVAMALDAALISLALIWAFMNLPSSSKEVLLGKLGIKSTRGAKS